MLNVEQVVRRLLLQRHAREGARVHHGRAELGQADDGGKLREPPVVLVAERLAGPQVVRRELLGGAVPLAWNKAGLPLGMMFSARYGDEATLFRLAGQLEQARPWKSRLPPVCA